MTAMDFPDFLETTIIEHVRFPDPSDTRSPEEITKENPRRTCVRTEISAISIEPLTIKRIQEVDAAEDFYEEQWNTPQSLVILDCGTKLLSLEKYSSVVTKWQEARRKFLQQKFGGPEDF